MTRARRSRLTAIGVPVRRRARLPLLVALAALLLGAALATTAQAAIRYKRSGEATLGGPDALAGVQSACEIDGRHVWVAVEGRGECIAFYATSGIEGAGKAVLYFEGDIPPSYRRDAEKLGGHLKSMRQALEILAKTHRIPYALVARPGTFGSTGSHGDRRKDREALVMREAVAAIQRLHGLKELSLAGQSGGATLAGALLTLGLPGVRCAAPASGGFDLVAMLDWHAQKQGLVGSHREHPASLAGSFDVIDRVGGIIHDPRRRIYVIGDQADKVTPFHQQRRFAEALRMRGHHAEIIEAVGSGPERHGLALTSLRIAGLCASGASDEEIRKSVDRR